MKNGIQRAYRSSFGILAYSADRHRHLVTAVLPRVGDQTSQLIATANAELEFRGVTQDDVLHNVDEEVRIGARFGDLTLRDARRQNSG